MQLLFEESVVTQETDDDNDGISHVFCVCNENEALCGKDITGEPEVEEVPSNEMACIVCYDLEGIPCPRCGE